MRLHPFHIMVVHFPTSLLIMDMIFSTIALYGGYEKLSYTAYHCLVAGVIGGWAAIVSGLYDLFRYQLTTHGEEIKTAMIHGGIQTTVVLGFTFVLSAEYNYPIYIGDAPLWLWIVKGMLITLMLAGNYFGGELLLRYVSKKTNG